MLNAWEREISVPNALDFFFSCESNASDMPVYLAVMKDMEPFQTGQTQPTP